MFSFRKKKKQNLDEDKEIDELDELFDYKLEKRGKRKDERKNKHNYLDTDEEYRRVIEWKKLAKKIDEFYEELAQNNIEDHNEIRRIFNEKFISVQNLLKELSSDSSKGIIGDLRVSQRFEAFGSNILSYVGSSTYCEILKGYMMDIIIIILISLSTIVFIVQSIKLGISPKITRDDWIELIEPIIILGVVFLVVNITTYNDYKQLKDQEKLRDQSKKDVKLNVIRNSSHISIQSQEILVGDLVMLNYGDNLCADGVLVESFGLTLDESALSGESQECLKDVERDFLLFSPTDVVDGSGTMLVLAVGINSKYGKICKSLGLLKDDDGINNNNNNNRMDDQEELRDESDEDNIYSDSSVYIEESSINSSSKTSSNNDDNDDDDDGVENKDKILIKDNDNSIKIKEEKMKKKMKKNKKKIKALRKESKNLNPEKRASVLQQKQNDLTKILTIISVILGIIVLIFRIVVVCKDFRQNKDKISKLEFTSKLLDALQLANMIIVVGVPEGILIATTLTATIAAKRMRKEGCNVQFISACETMGNATVICSDKTGTLTQNQMNVEMIFLDNKIYEKQEFAKIINMNFKPITNRIRSINDEIGNEELQQQDARVNFEKFDKNFLNLLKWSILLNCYQTSIIKKSSSANIKKSSKLSKFTEDIIGKFMDNTNEKSDIDSPPDSSSYSLIQSGNKTECALLALCEDLSIDTMAERDNLKSNILRIFSFNSKRKFMAAIAKHPENPEKLILFVKGASEVILEKVKHIMMRNGEIRILSEKEKNEIYENSILKLCSFGFRTLVLAFRILEKSEFEKFCDDSNGNSKHNDHNQHHIENLLENLILLAIPAIADPIRPEVPRSVRCVQSAGVKVIMVTGDNLETAKYVASKCNIYDENNEDHLALTSAQFNKLIKSDKGFNGISQTNFDRIWPNLKVLARSQPEDKKTLVDGIIASKSSFSSISSSKNKNLHNDPYNDYNGYYYYSDNELSRSTMNRREIVAVTGDGTNDTLALKSADIGFAMGQSGTDMARNAADIIIQDDNFASIVKALVWGRNMYDSITKFLQFQLTTNLEVLLLVVSTANEEYYPLHAIPLLWLNILMDTFASLSLATDWPHKEQLERNPRGKNESLISNLMIRKIVGHVLYEMTILLTLFFSFNSIAYPLFFFTKTPNNGIDFALNDNKSNANNSIAQLSSKTIDLFRNTFIFNTLVMFTLFNEFNARMVMGERNVFKRISRNYKFLFFWALSFSIQHILILFLGDYIGLQSLAISKEAFYPSNSKLSRALSIFWFFTLSTLIASSTLIFEQILLLILPNRFIDANFRRKYEIKKAKQNHKKFINSKSASLFSLRSRKSSSKEFEGFLSISLQKDHLKRSGSFKVSNRNHKSHQFNNNYNNNKNQQNFSEYNLI